MNVEPLSEKEELAHFHMLQAKIEDAGARCAFGEKVALVEDLLALSKYSKSPTVQQLVFDELSKFSTPVLRVPAVHDATVTYQ